MTELPGWLTYSAQHRSDPLRHARPNPNTTAGVSAYFDVTAACGQQARIPVGTGNARFPRGGRTALFDPEHPKACKRCAKATRAQPWATWRWSAYGWHHDPAYQLDRGRPHRRRGPGFRQAARLDPPPWPGPLPRLLRTRQGGHPMSADWFACEEPERPTDAWVLWHYAGELFDLPRWPTEPDRDRTLIGGICVTPEQAAATGHPFDGGTGCRGCQIKAQALAHQHPDDPHVAWLLQAVGAEGAP